MSEYKRLTKKGTTYVTNDGEHDIIVQISADNSEQPLYDLEDICSKLNRLVELEDKIESGQWVELPCKLDNDVYYIGNLGNDKIIYCTQLANLKGYQLRNPQEFGYYTDKAQAEARLKELKGESV